MYGEEYNQTLVEHENQDEDNYFTASFQNLGPNAYKSNSGK